jgi:hypothetical protein
MAADETPEPISFKSDPNMPHFTVVTAQAETVWDPTVLEEHLLGGPRSDADWANATVTLKVPIHGTAQTTVQEVDVPIQVLAALIKKALWTDVIKVGESGR